MLYVVETLVLYLVITRKQLLRGVAHRRFAATQQAHGVGALHGLGSCMRYLSGFYVGSCKMTSWKLMNLIK